MCILETCKTKKSLLVLVTYSNAVNSPSGWFFIFLQAKKEGKKWPQLVHLRKKSRYTSHAGSHAHFYQGSMIIVRIQTMPFSIYRYQPSQLWRLCRWQLLRRGGGCEVEGETDQYAEASVLQAELCVYLLTSARVDICQHVPLY